MDPTAIQPLLQTTINSCGQPIAWPQGGTPEITALLIEMAPGEETGWHSHPVPLVGYIMSGALTVYQATGEKRIVDAGENSLESVGIVHNGVNEGAIPCRMIVYVIGLKDLPFTTKASPPSA